MKVLAINGSYGVNGNTARMIHLVAAGEIGGVANSHYAFMGYNLQPRILLEQTTPKIIRNLRDEAVDIVVLMPA